MSVKKRGNSFSWVLKRGGKEYWTRIPAKSLSEARKIEQECCTALRSGDYFTLTPAARETLIRLHDTQEWAYPPGLRIDLSTDSGEFILWDNPKEDENRESKGAIQLFWNHPLIQQKQESTRKRYKMCFAHLIRLLGKNTPVRDIGVDQIHEYYAKRISEGVSPNTIGYEVSTLSAIFTVLMSKKNLTGVTENPCELVRGRGALSLSFSSKRRSAYWSYDLINAITTVWSTSTQRSLCPDWLVPIMWASYYTGMRLGEVLGLKRHQVYLHRRMIFMTPLDQKIKEGEPKRVPIHRDLEPHLENALRVRALGIDNVFLVSDRQGTRPVTKDCVELAMRRIVKVLNPNPRFSFFDLRHTFKANCRRSGIPEVISERICGHADADGYLDGKLPVSQRYGRISDEEFIDAIDNLTVNHGYSEINAKPVSFFGFRQNLQPEFEDSVDNTSGSLSPVRKNSAIG